MHIIRNFKISVNNIEFFKKILIEYVSQKKINTMQENLYVL